MPAFAPEPIMQELCTSAAQTLADDIEGRGFEYAIFLAVVDPSDTHKETILGTEVINLPKDSVLATIEFLKLMILNLQRGL